MSITHWNKLVKTALIGTNRSSNTIFDDPEIQQYLSDHSVQPEEKILEATVFIIFLKKSGFKPSGFSGEFDLFDEKEHLKSIGPKSGGDLKKILYGLYEPALPEYLGLLFAKQKRIPDDMLPDVLGTCKTKPELWDALSRCIGKKGSWLIAKNPDWQYLTVHPDPSNWPYAVLKERVAILQYLRKNETGSDVELLRSTWHEDSVSDKVELLKALREGLSRADEPFLEECLDSKRKEVRKLAARLLAMLPDSELSNRVFSRLEKLLNIKRHMGIKTKFQVNLPERCDEAMIRDGVDPGARWFKGGVKVSRLGQMVAITHPKRWEALLKKDAHAALRVFERSEWSEMLVQALIEATAFHKDENWMLALLDFGFNHNEKNRFQNLNFLPLIGQMTPKVFNEVSTKFIATEKDLLPEGHLACQILKNTFFPWNDKLTLAITSSLSLWMGFETSRYWNGWHYRSLLKKAAYLSRPGIVEKIEYVWPKNSRIWQSWEKEIYDFLDILKFRKQLNENILK